MKVLIFLSILFFSLSASAQTDLGEAYSIPPCNEEMVNNTVELGKAIEKRYNRMSSVEKIKYLTDREKQNQDFIEHEIAHKTTADKWTYGPYYYTILLDNLQVILCACVLYDINTPLTIRLKSTLAPNNPSSIDLTNAERYRVKMKKGFKTWIK